MMHDARSHALTRNWRFSSLWETPPTTTLQSKPPTLCMLLPCMPTTGLAIFQVLLLYAAPGVESLGIIRYCRNLLLPPSSTFHLASLLEAYDVIQDPSSFIRSSSWDIFDDIIADVQVTTDGVVAGQGLIAKRDFRAGEVVALYPIHALGYGGAGKAVKQHDPSQRRHPNNKTEASDNNVIVGSSDLVCFRDEARQFGVVDCTGGTTGIGDKEEEDGAILEEEDVDFTYAMLDPSERYVFDVNPSRAVRSLFVAHFVNDAAAADFHSMEQQQSFDDTVGATLTYLEESTSNFNVVMTPFGPPPLMAYVTVKPVSKGSELLATYGLDYWLGKADQDSTQQEVMRERLEGAVSQQIDRADKRVAEALHQAKAAVGCSRYATHTGLIGTAVADLIVRPQKSKRRFFSAAKLRAK